MGEIENEQFQTLLAEIVEYALENNERILPRSRISLKDVMAYQTMKGLKGAQKVQCLEFLMHSAMEKNATVEQDWAKELDEITPRIRTRVSSHCHSYFLFNLLNMFWKTRFDFSKEDFLRVFALVKHMNITINKDNFLSSLSFFEPIVEQLKQHIKRDGRTDEIRSVVEKMLSETARGTALFVQLRFLLEAAEPTKVKPYVFGEGMIGSLLSADYNKMSAEEQKKWQVFFQHLERSTAAKPTSKWLKDSKAFSDEIGTVAFKKHATAWLLQITQMEIIQVQNRATWVSPKGKHIENRFKNWVKGLVWSMSRFHDSKSLQMMAVLAEKCFQKIPGQGPAAPAIGNAAIYTLAQSKGLEGVSHLSRLKMRIRQNNTQKLIQGYIEQQAAKLGLKPAQIEEIAAPDFGLVAGEKREEFKDFTLVLKMTGIGKTELQWIKPDGKIQKSVPAFVKDNKPLMAKLKKIRATAAELKKASTTQRDRIDRLFVEDMSWTLEDFEKYYLHHGLVSQIAQKLIWSLDGAPALYVDGGWQEVTGQAVQAGKDVTFTLWHPIQSSAENVLAWRDRLEALEIQQPFKQAWREIYPLTEAEINTAVYSNRMAAHFLKQHQFNSLTALRGWKYSLLGAYDDGRDGEIARKALPSCKLEAQFWINEILDDNESWNDAGIWLYVATDQLRFNNEAGEAVPLIDVPKLIFSEVMRDVDLFVGVASVGNDPTWQDGGPNERPDYRDYWQSYSFGDLNEMAKTRKTVLERLLPRLKIKDVAHIEGKFLIVDGTRHSYKIHIGSGNILIAPEDKYLCIVPGRGKDKNLAKVFLPFEGDNGLSIVLSKAFMLAEDDKITDKTILSQL